MVNLLYEERQQKLKDAIGEEKIRIAEEVESLREAVEKKRELKQLQKVDQHLANIDVEFYKLRDDLSLRISMRICSPTFLPLSRSWMRSSQYTVS